MTRRPLAEVTAILGGAPRLKTAILLTPDPASRADRKLLSSFAHSSVIHDSLSAEEIATQIG